MRYRIAIRQSDEGYSAAVPCLPGCWSQGDTEAEAVENIKDAIRDYLTVVEEQLQGEEISEIDIAVRPCPVSPASTTSMPCALCGRLGS